MYQVQCKLSVFHATSDLKVDEVKSSCYNNYDQ